MKLLSKIFLILASVSVIISCEKDKSESKTKDVVMGPNYENDIYYSMSKGIVKEVNRTNWDIGFGIYDLQAFGSSSIIINEGNGIELYYDTTFRASQWEENTYTENDLAGFTRLYNSKQSWNMGAFNTNSVPPFNYGWGEYNMQSHSLTGISYFIIKTGTVTKKILITSLNSMVKKFYFKCANLDNSGEMTDSVDYSAFSGKNYIHYSVQNMEVVDREPLSADWDILFTKYIEYVQYPAPTYYPVMGVLSNLHTKAVAVSSDIASAPEINDSTVNAVGYDWKIQDNVTHEFSIDETKVYFIKTQKGYIYKLKFIDTEGQSTGKVSFDVTKQ